MANRRGHADGLQDGEEQGEERDEAQDGGIGQGRGAHQGLVADEAAARQDQNPQALQGQEAPRPAALILPEAVPEKIMEFG